ncbi:MAG: class I SAM-dependent methyltransferase [Acidobacteriota bacterium]|nr:class I SAM-dependent methyltransferase [Acidobacteriota bacterium]
MRVESRRAFALWAPLYESAPNPLVSLETRIVGSRLPELRGQIVVDAASGAGRWGKIAVSRGARAVYTDICPEMLMRVREGACVQADMRALPFPDNFADLAICSLALGYVPSASPALRELGRVARRVIVSDLHPDAVRAGWARSFRAGGRSIQIAHYSHSIRDIDLPGMAREWVTEARFGPAELAVFRAAGREDLFASACSVNALYAASWVRQ